MSVADRIGLFRFVGWIAGHEFPVTLLICLAGTLGMMWALALVLEGRKLPLSSSAQFESFFPGVLYLGVAIAACMHLASYLPEESRWYNGTLWHGIVLIAMLALAAGMTIMEWREGIYPRRALISPTKLYVNFVLVGGFGYVAVTSFTAVAAGSDWDSFNRWKIAMAAVAFACGFRFAVAAARDSTLTKRKKSEKSQKAHVADWRPIWHRP